MRRSILTVILLSALMMIVGYGCGKKEPVVAVVNNKQVITLADLQKEYGNIQEKYSIDQIRSMLNQLDRMIENRLKVIEARARQYDQDSSIVAQLEKETRGLILRELYTVEIEDHIVSEKDIRDYFARQNKKITFRKILIAGSPKMLQTEKDSLKNEAEQLLQTIREGGNFIQLAKVHSDDRKSALNGGLVKGQVWTQWDDPVMSTAYKMDEGEISDIIEVNNGFVIIQIESTEPNNLKPYEQMRESLRSRLLAQRRPELRDYYNEYWQNLKEESELVYNDSLIGFLSQLFLENINHTDKFVRLCKEHEASVEDNNIVTYKDGEINMSDLAQRMSEADIRVKIMLRDSLKLRDYITNQALLDVLYDMARDKHLDQLKTVKEAINEKAEKLMLNKIDKIEIDNKILMHVDNNKIKEDVKSDYKKELKDKIRDKFISELKEKYPVVIYKETMESIVDYN